jgi:hypothetical protein
MMIRTGFFVPTGLTQEGFVNTIIMDRAFSIQCNQNGEKEEEETKHRG